MHRARQTWDSIPSLWAWLTTGCWQCGLLYGGSSAIASALALAFCLFLDCRTQSHLVVDRGKWQTSRWADGWFYQGWSNEKAQFLSGGAWAPVQNIGETRQVSNCLCLVTKAEKTVYCWQNFNECTVRGSSMFPWLAFFFFSFLFLTVKSHPKGNDVNHW